MVACRKTMGSISHLVWKADSSCSLKIPEGTKLRNNNFTELTIMRQMLN